MSSSKLVFAFISIVIVIQNSEVLILRELSHLESISR